MKPPQYALVAYVRSPAGEFAENLRKELHPGHPDMAAHITVLPPRCISGTETEALEQIAEVCKKVEPFEVGLGDVESFVPMTPTIFIRVAHAAYRMRELHDHLNCGPLLSEEPWPYMPHLTIIKLADPEAAQRAMDMARKSWAEYQGPRRIVVEELTFVREGRDIFSWQDLAPIPLGSRMAPVR